MTHAPSVRIDQVVFEFSQSGGLETVAFELQRAFRTNGVDARVIASVTPDAAPDIHRLAPLLARIGSRGRLRHIGRLLTVPAFTIAATLHLYVTRRQREGRVVLSHGDTLAGDVVVVHAVNRANLDMKRATGGWRWRLNPMHYWVSARDRIMIGGLRFRRYVALSERIASELQRYYGVPSERIVLIPNGVDLERFNPAPDDRAKTRLELGLGATTPILLFVGHEFSRKGLAHVIDALAQPGMGDAMLLVAGAGAPAQFAQQAKRLSVQDRVVFLGPRHDLPRLYRAADAFVFPTAYEAFGLTCMEAMACGLPVFATAVGGIEEYLQDGVNGQFIRADGAAIAAVVTPFLNASELQARFRSGALATAQQYAWPLIALRYCDLLREVSSEIEAVRRFRTGARQWARPNLPPALRQG